MFSPNVDSKLTPCSFTKITSFIEPAESNPARKLQARDTDSLSELQKPSKKTKSLYIDCLEHNGEKLETIAWLLALLKEL
jgi:hypothetical protein